MWISLFFNYLLVWLFNVYINFELIFFMWVTAWCFDSIKLLISALGRRVKIV